MRKKYTWAIVGIIGVSIITGLGISIPFMIPPSHTIELLPDNYWPTDEWLTVTPERLNMSSSKFEEMYDYIQMNSVNLHSVLIVRNNFIVEESFLQNYVRRDEDYFAPNWMVPTGANHMHHIWSCTKSVISLLIGIAIEMGYIDNISQTIYEFFEDYWHPSYDIRKKDVTIEHLLTQTSGFPYGYYETYQSYIEESLNETLLFDPGTNWEYSNTGCMLLSGIINVTTGMKTSEFAREYLFEPIGISQEDWSWWQDYQGTTSGAYGLHISPRAMARIGILCLNYGSWNGTQVVPEEWIEESITPSFFSGYGYLWWLNPVYYLAGGYLGQWITMIPEYNITVILTAEIAEGTYSSRYNFIINTFIIGAII